MYDEMFAGLSMQVERQQPTRESLRAAVRVIACFARVHRRLLLRIVAGALGGDALAVEFLQANLPRHLRVVVALITAVHHCMIRFLSVGALVPALLAIACSEPSPSGFSGYMEGEYVRVASPFAGELALLQVKRGDTIAAGAPLFALEQDSEKAAREEARARVKQAQAKLADLQKGRRPQELDSARAQLAQAEANLRLSSSELKRNQELVTAGFISAAKLDEVRSAEQRDRARVQQLKADLAVARLAARPDEIAAAAADVKAASDALAQAEWKLQQKSQTATQAALVADTLYQQGEWVPAGSPVVSLLPPENVKARFFVPETQVGSLRVGQRVLLRCDACGEPVEATLSFIASQAEYTPPVIYSRESRAKLVFMVEARPNAGQAARLHPGQPIVAEVLPFRVAQEQ